MTQTMPYAQLQEEIRIPDWLYSFTDELFLLWCKQHKLHVSEEVRDFTREERAAIYRYMDRQNLLD